MGTPCCITAVTGAEVADFSGTRGAGGLGAALSSAAGSSATGVCGVFAALGTFFAVDFETLAVAVLGAAVGSAISSAGMDSSAGGSDSGLAPARQGMFGELQQYC